MKDLFLFTFYELLEKEYKKDLAVPKEEITATLADKHLANVLRMKLGNPVLLCRRKMCEPGDRLMESNPGYYRVERFTYAIEQDLITFFKIQTTREFSKSQLDFGFKITYIYVHNVAPFILLTDYQFLN